MNIGKIITGINFLLFANVSSGLCSPLASCTYDLCAPLTCKTNNGIHVVSGLDEKDVGIVESAYITSNDSITLAMQVGCGFTSIKIYLDGIIIYSVEGGLGYARHMKIFPKPGYYLVDVIAGSAYYKQVGFTLLSNPTGLAERSKEINNSIMVFPNPASDEITVVNSNEPIKTIIIYNSLDQQLTLIKVNSSTVEIPLNNYPSGLYFIHVATLSDKIIIKKLIKL